jgi:hypothetical protein
MARILAWNTKRVTTNSIKSLMISVAITLLTIAASQTLLLTWYMQKQAKELTYSKLF